MKTNRNKWLVALSFLFMMMFGACAQKQEQVAVLTNMPKVISSQASWNKLTAAENNVIANKGTELPGSGALLHNKSTGIYICKRCNEPVYNSSSKFESNTGWPSFDDEIKGSVKHVKDADGFRNELLCANCGAHLGHAFYGEGFTKKDVRNCINSLSLSFVAQN